MKKIMYMLMLLLCLSTAKGFSFSMDNLEVTPVVGVCYNVIDQYASYRYGDLIYLSVIDNEFEGKVGVDITYQVNDVIGLYLSTSETTKMFKQSGIYFWPTNQRYDMLFGVKFWNISLEFNHFCDHPTRCWMTDGKYSYDAARTQIGIWYGK